MRKKYGKIAANEIGIEIVCAVLTKEMFNGKQLEWNVLHNSNALNVQHFLYAFPINDVNITTRTHKLCELMWRTLAFSHRIYNLISSRCFNSVPSQYSSAEAMWLAFSWGVIAISDVFFSLLRLILIAPGERQIREIGQIFDRISEKSHSSHSVKIPTEWLQFDLSVAWRESVAMEWRSIRCQKRNALQNVSPFAECIVLSSFVVYLAGRATAKTS